MPDDSPHLLVGVRRVTPSGALTTMPEFLLSNESLQALNEGKKVKLTDADLGRSGYNGSVTLVPEEGNEHLLHLLPYREEFIEP